jgi:ribosomal protein L37AE/L43A
MKNKNKYELIKETIKKLKDLDSDKFYFINAKLECPHCNHEFGIEREYNGVITCPYCGKYVEG